MFKIFKRKKFRGANELFSNKKIFDAKNKELDNILSELTTNSDSNSKTAQSREIIRAITILTIKNNRYAKKIQYFNIVLSILLVFLTIRTINLTVEQLKLTAEQTSYTELSTRSERIRQVQIIRNAIEHCEKNPELIESRLSYIKNGEFATCSAVLNSNFLKEYKN